MYRHHTECLINTHMDVHYGKQSWSISHCTELWLATGKQCYSLLKHLVLPHDSPSKAISPHMLTVQVRTFCLFPMTHMKDSVVQYTCFSTLNVDTNNIGKQNIRVLLIILIISMTKKSKRKMYCPKNYWNRLYGQPFSCKSCTACSRRELNTQSKIVASGWMKLSESERKRGEILWSSGKLCTRRQTNSSTV